MSELLEKLQAAFPGFRCEADPPVHQSGMEPPCRRKWMFQTKCRLRSPSLPSALNLGSLFHALMGGYFKSGGDFAVGVGLANGIITEKVNEMTPLADKYGMLPNGRSVEDITLEMGDNLNKAQAMARILIASHPFDPAKYRVLAVEETLSAVVPVADYSPGIQIEGTVDMILKERETGNIWIPDWKTTSFDPVTLCASYAFSKQARVYRLLVTANYGPPTGFVYCAIRKPTIKYCKKDADFDAYVQRCIAWYAAENQKDGVQPHVQSWVRYTEPLVPDELAVQLVDACELGCGELDLAKYHRNERECLGRYGNSLCPFHKLCSSPTGGWASLLKANYVVAPQVIDDEEDAE